MRLLKALRGLIIPAGVSLHVLACKAEPSDKRPAGHAPASQSSEAHPPTDRDSPAYAPPPPRELYCGTQTWSIVGGMGTCRSRADQVTLSILSHESVVVDSLKVAISTDERFVTDCALRGQAIDPRLGAIVTDTWADTFPPPRLAWLFDAPARRITPVPADSLRCVQFWVAHPHD